MNKLNEFSNRFIAGLLDALKYIFKVVIIGIIAIMVIIPIVLKNTKVKGDDLVIFKKQINIMAINGKTNIKLFDSYISTGINYSEYDRYITKYKAKNIFSKSILVEVNTLFILLEIICLYYIIINLIKLFVEKEDREYNIYVIKKAFVTNSISFLAISLFRRFIFRNTIFSNLNTSLVIIYLFTIFMFMVFYKIVEMDKIDIKKAIQNEKYKKNK